MSERPSAERLAQIRQLRVLFPEQEYVFLGELLAEIDAVTRERDEMTIDLATQLLSAGAFSDDPRLAGLHEVWVSEVVGRAPSTFKGEARSLTLVEAQTIVNAWRALGGAAHEKSVGLAGMNFITNRERGSR